MTVAKDLSPRSTRKQRAEHIASITGLVTPIIGIFVLTWVFVDRYVNENLCKLPEHDIWTDLSRSRHTTALSHNCIPLSDNMLWVSIPASIAVSCLVLAFIATIAFVISVLNQDKTEKLGNMTPKWKRPYLGALGCLTVIFAISLLVTVMAYYEIILEQYGMSLF